MTECRFNPGDAALINDTALVASAYIGQIGIIAGTILMENGCLAHIHMNDDVLLLCVPESELTSVSDDNILKRDVQEWGEDTSGS